MTLRVDRLDLLLVEDDAADARLFVEGLREQVEAGRVSVRVSRSVAQALDALREARFDCALVDLGLPDAQGLSHVRQLRDALPHAPIIVLTGRADPRAAQEAFGLGARDYLIKGDFHGDELLAFVRKAIADFTLLPRA